MTPIRDRPWRNPCGGTGVAIAGTLALLGFGYLNGALDDLIKKEKEQQRQVEFDSPAARAARDDEWTAYLAFNAQHRNVLGDQTISRAQFDENRRKRDVDWR